MSHLEQEQMLSINRAAWDQVAPRFFGGTVLPSYGPLTPTEEKLQLLDPIPGTRVLEVGCGSGHSLRYLADRGAAEVWGLDLSRVQLAYAADVLQPFANVHLLESAMEVNPGLPANYFDVVLSIYGLGWTTDLPGTLALIAAYLRPGGCLIFSGEHPVYSCLEYSNRRFVFERPYTSKTPEVDNAWCGVASVRHIRTLATFINEVVRAGLHIEQFIESELDDEQAKQAHTDPARWYSTPRARLVPTTFIVKARKPAAPGTAGGQH